MSLRRARIGWRWVIPLSRGWWGEKGEFRESPAPVGSSCQGGAGAQRRRAAGLGPAWPGRRHVGQRQSRRRGNWSRRGDGRIERGPGLLPALACRAGLSPPPAAGTGSAPLGAWAEGRLGQRGLWESSMSLPHHNPPRHPVAMVTRISLLPQ